MDYPELTDHLVMVAPLIDPEHEIIFWFSYLGYWKPFRWMAPVSLRVAADEKFGSRTMDAR